MGSNAKQETFANFIKFCKIVLRYADVIIMQKIRCKALWGRYADKHSKQNGIFTGASSRKQTFCIERR